MDNSKKESNFCSLPFQIQLDILSKLSLTDRKIARLTCTDWFTLINFVQNFSFTISDSDYVYFPTILKWPFYSRVGSLRLWYVGKPIPIYSSRRVEIPRAAELFIYLGNSEENIVKLLRYYAGGCKSLSFGANCFMKVVNLTRMRIDVVLANITKFTFTFCHYNLSSNIRVGLGEYNHTIALSEFLAATNMPNLKTFAVYVANKNMNVSALAVASDTKFTKNFGIFLDEHAKCISSFFFSCGIAFCGPLFQHLSKLHKVTNLTCCLNFLFDTPPEVKEVLLTSFKSYTELNSFIFGVSLDRYTVYGREIGDVGEDVYAQLTTMMLANNQRTLTTFTNLHLHRSLDWIHKNSYHNLKFLKFGVHFDRLDWFKNELSRGYRFPMLREMEVTAINSNEDYESDSGNAFIHWIVQVAPDLKYLTIGRGDQFINLAEQLTELFCLAHFRTLILGCLGLKYLKIHYWSASAEVDNWLKDQEQIEYSEQSFRHHAVILKIQRPFSETVCCTDRLKILIQQ